jgi:hypothetical protein
MLAFLACEMLNAAQVGWSGPLFLMVGLGGLNKRSCWACKFVDALCHEAAGFGLSVLHHYVIIFAAHVVLRAVPSNLTSLAGLTTSITSGCARVIDAARGLRIIKRQRLERSRPYR